MRQLVRHRSNAIHRHGGDRVVESPTFRSACRLAKRLGTPVSYRSEEDDIPAVGRQECCVLKGR